MLLGHTMLVVPSMLFILIFGICWLILPQLITLKTTEMHDIIHRFWYFGIAYRNFLQANLACNEPNFLSFVSSSHSILL